MDEAGGRMTPPVPIRQDIPERERVTPWQSMKVLGFLVILFGPILPLTIFLWRLAVGG